MKRRLFALFLCFFFVTACHRMEKPENTVSKYITAAQNLQVMEQINYLEKPLSKDRIEKEKHQLESQKNSDPDIADTYQQMEKSLKDTKFSFGDQEVKRNNATVHVRIHAKDISSSTKETNSIEVAVQLTKKDNEWKIKPQSAKELDAALLGSIEKLSDQSLYTDLQISSNQMQAKVVIKKYLDACKEYDFKTQQTYLENEDYIDTIKTHMNTIKNLYTGSETLSSSIEKHLDASIRNLKYEMKETTQKDETMEVHVTITTKEIVATIIDSVNSSIETMNEEIKKNPTMETKNRLEKEMFEKLDSAVQNAPQRNIDTMITLVKKDLQWKITDNSADRLTAAIYGSNNEKMFEPKKEE